MEITFKDYDPEDFAPDSASRKHCSWHGKDRKSGQHSANCSVGMIWSVFFTDPKSRFSACKNAGHDILRHYESQLHMA